MLDHPPGRLKIAATYRVSQPIENFVLRIKIVEQKSLLAELFESEGETRDPNSLVVEERDFAWQEKIFSPDEVKFYGDEKNCITELQKEYNEKITRENGENREGSRVYSYTHRDSYYPEKSILTNNYVSQLSKRNENALPIIKNRKPFPERYNKKVVDTCPNDNHYLYKDPMKMYILADLSSKDDLVTPPQSNIASPDSEILLCTLSYDRATKTLTIDPDLSGDNNYTLRTSDFYYDYWIEDVSRRATGDDRSEQPGQFSSHASKERKSRCYGAEDAMYEEMVMPPGNILRLFVNLEIASAQDYQYGPLFVSYKVDLPRHWAISGHDGESERLTGTSQRCCPVNGRANFSYVTEIPLDFDLNCLNAVDTVQPAWPYIIFTVGSIDHWTRYRIEGYACIPLPASPGAHSFDLPTWRPIGRFVNVLRRFFTGGTAELEDVTYCGIPESRRSGRLEKTPLKVIPGGSISINLNIAHQSKIFTKRRQGEAFEKLNASTLINSLDNALVQFKAARDRMIQAKSQSINFSSDYK